MSIATRPEIPLQLITPADVRASIRRALRSLEKAAEEIVWQIEMEAWRTLGYPSWSAMREAEYGGAAVMLPTGSRPRVAARLKAIQVGTTSRGGPKHLTDQEIADTLGVDRTTVQADLGTKGKTRDIPQNVEPDSDVDVVEAEIVQDGEPGPANDEFCRSCGADTNGCDCQPTPDATTDPAPAEPAVITVACPTCNGTGKVTR